MSAGCWPQLRLWCGVLLLGLAVTPGVGGLAQAGEAVPMAVDEAVEKRMVAISEELRCLVCQNESLAGSHADLAQDLRREIRSLIKQGKSDEEIMDFMVSRYGDFVRYRPPVKSTTYLLWFGPFLLLIGAVIGLIVHLRRRSRNNGVDSGAPALSAEESRRLAALLEQNEKNS